MSDTQADTHASSSLQGASPDLSDPAARDKALLLALDYRGDVTVATTDGRSIEGYLYDRGHRDGAGYVRIIPKDGSGRVRIEDHEITGLLFSGRDTASGKSWETWIRKHAEKKARGEAASLEPEDLTDPQA